MRPGTDCRFTTLGSRFTLRAVTPRPTPALRAIALVPLLFSLTHCAAGDGTGGDASRDSGRDDVNNTDVTEATIGDVIDADDDVSNILDAGDLDAHDSSTSDSTDAAADTMRPDVCMPTTEVCNGIDENCDGVIDESGCPGHLLLNEVVLAPNAAEFIEIYNPTDHDIALSDVYLTDSAVYPRLISAMAPPVIDPSDFVARFPVGATIASHAYQTVATGSPNAFPVEFAGQCPTYFLQTTATVGTCLSAIVMRPLPVGPNSIGTSATLTNAGEPIMLFTWDGTSDLVHDIDYAYVGAPGMSGTTILNDAVDKSMLFVDGPDTDTMATGYQLDTPASLQSFAPLPATGGSAVRCAAGETGEILLGGNGVFGHNETSEHLAMTWATTTAASAADGGLPGTFNATPNAMNHCP